MDDKSKVGIEIGDFVIVTYAEQRVGPPDKETQENLKKLSSNPYPSSSSRTSSPFYVGILGRVIDADIKRIEKLSGTRFEINELELLVTDSSCFNFLKISLYPNKDFFSQDKWTVIRSSEEIIAFYERLKSNKDVHYHLRDSCDHGELKKRALADYEILKEANLKGNYPQVIR